MKKAWSVKSWFRRRAGRKNPEGEAAALVMERRLVALERAMAFAVLKSVPSRAGAPASESADAARPVIADLLLHLPGLKTNAAGIVDFAGSDAELLQTLADNADSACKVLLRGMSAIGSLLAHAGPEIEDGSVSADALEAVGVLLSEMSELSGMLLALDGNCRRALSG